MRFLYVNAIFEKNPLEIESLLYTEKDSLLLLYIRFSLMHMLDLIWRQQISLSLTIVLYFDVGKVRIFTHSNNEYYKDIERLGNIELMIESYN